MTPAEVLRKLSEYREEYRKQGFSFTKEQQAEYDRLRKLRYERVNYFVKNGLVSKGGGTNKQTKEETK